MADTLFSGMVILVSTVMYALTKWQGEYIGMETTLMLSDAVYSNTEKENNYLFKH